MQHKLKRSSLDVNIGRQRFTDLDYAYDVALLTEMHVWKSHIWVNTKVKLYRVYVLAVLMYDTIRYDTRCYFNVRSKADISQLNLPHGTDN